MARSPAAGKSLRYSGSAEGREEGKNPPTLETPSESLTTPPVERFACYAGKPFGGVERRRREGSKSDVHNEEVHIGRIQAGRREDR